jgi:predicted SprT family Zn-dependent metalloprotease
MTNQEAQELAIQLMTEHGLIAQGWGFEFDNSRKRLGVCKYDRFGGVAGTIGLSKYLLPHVKNAKIKDTILHEIAHAIAGHAAGHGPKWQRIARQIGCDAKRCYNVSAFRAGAREKILKQSKYNLVCPECGHKSAMARRPKRNRSCGFCNPHGYDEKFKMQLVQNY